MAYIAPEIINLNTTGLPDMEETFYSEKCDMWSIGVIAYMLLAGKNPFLMEQDQAKLKKNIMAFKASSSKIFEADEFRTLDDSSKSFIIGLLTEKVDERMSATQALEHKFIVNVSN